MSAATRMMDNEYVFGGGDVGMVVVIGSVGVASVTRVSASTRSPGNFGMLPDDRRDDARDGGRIWE